MPKLKNLYNRIFIHVGIFIISEVTFWLPMTVSLAFMPIFREDTWLSSLHILIIFLNVSYMLINDINHLHWIYGDVHGVSIFRACFRIKYFIIRVYILGESITEYCNNEIHIPRCTNHFYCGSMHIRFIRLYIHFICSIFDSNY